MFKSKNRRNKVNELTQIADLERQRGLLMGYCPDSIKNKSDCRMATVGSSMAGLADFMLNDYVIVRTEASGVHYGKVAEFDATRKQLLLADARRIYSWEKEWTLHEVSLNGFTKGHVSQPIPLFFVCDVCELIPCSEAAVKAINSIPPFIE